MKYPMLVTAAIIEDNGKYLITQRPDDGRHNAQKWEFPGGKIDFGEEPRKCLEREIEHELGIKVKATDIFGYSSYIYDNEKHIILLGFICKLLSKEIKKLDISDYKWVTPEEMNKYDISEADLPFVEKLKRTSASR